MAGTFLHIPVQRIDLYIYYLHKFEISRVRPFKQYILLCIATIGSIPSHKGTLTKYDFSFGSL